MGTKETFVWADGHAMQCADIFLSCKLDACMVL